MNGKSENTQTTFYFINPTMIWPIIYIIVTVTFIKLLKSSSYDYIKRAILNYNKYKLIPGPKRWPFIGSALEMNKQRPFETFVKWANEYGEICLVTLFGKKILLLSSTETFEEALITRGKDFSGRPALFYRAKFMSDGHEDIVSTSPCPVWKVLRKGLQREMKVYDPSQRRIESITNQILDELIQELADTNGVPFDAREAIFTSLINMNCLFMIGNKLDYGGEKLEKVKSLVRIISTVMNIGGQGAELDYFPWLRFFGNKTFAKLVQAKEMRNDVFSWMLQKMKHDLESKFGVMHGFYKLILDNQPLLQEYHLQLVMTNLLIGLTSSSRSYFYSFINILAHYPNVQELMHREIVNVIGQGQRPSLADRPKMPYTRATLCELLRFSSISPITIPHSTITDTKIGKYDIPAGTTVFLMPRYIHHNTDLWKDPYTFDPMRFIDPETNDIYGPKSEVQRNLMAFGAGPRGCPGEAIATSRFFLMATNLIQRFIIEPADQDAGDVSKCDPRNFELGLVTNPPSFTAKFIRRRS
ncbi:hypothetical protein HELRODRAFT_102182 [Helobdella robusta]|uniref:Cytochrome P450 n=1 Tax=Helobdella robusta TaxID=6412 RepID=T1ED86_HELRO|nr:hypothetical protein HELRODRAFT_102182 [Helobdella robusta]ESN97253.1 hypothetical protein HELRODRAFT_102182 [Helobdella robusta]